MCRTSSLLHTLAAIARISPVCEKKAVFAICQMVKENNFDKDLVKKVSSSFDMTIMYGYDRMAIGMKLKQLYIESAQQ